MIKKLFFLTFYMIYSIGYSQCPGQEIEVVVNITPDNYPSETSWEFKHSDGTIIASGDTIDSTFCVLDSNCYIFTIFDSYGDGICCGYGQGSYFITYDSLPIATGGQFSYSETTLIGCPPGSDCNNPIYVTEGLQTSTTPENWFSFTPDTSGQFNINTCNSNCNTVIYLYDYCDGLIYDNSNQGTIYYSDDECNLQSEIFPLLQENQEYFIRISDVLSNCSGDSIPWEINYIGPVSGCMDSIACNYNPIATTPDSCIYFGTIDCPYQPDLTVIESELDGMYIDQISNSDQCMIDEGCIQGYGTRDLIRFTTWIKNIGNLDFYIGSPSASSNQFEFDLCHNHWHYDGYAEYVLYDENGQKTPAGFKNGFCVMDLECSDGGNYTYGCSTMGISAGCGDIYGSGLDCQWIDITDIDTGRYTFAIKVNWDQSPDALGNYESNYNNNWAQICFNLYRDTNGNPSITLDPNCPIYVDCAGTPYGNAQYDCNGICDGNAQLGDLDGDSIITINDSYQYIFEILNNTLANNCYDLNADGELTVSDAALSINCNLYGDNHIHTIGPHNHCNYGYEITNPFDYVSLSIENINLDSNYFDVYILNPNNEVLGYEFEIEGAQIINVENLIDSIIYPINPEFVFGGNKVVGLSLEDSLIIKNYLPTPLCRIHYNPTTNNSEICLSNIVDIVNHNYEDVITSIIGNNSCFSITINDINKPSNLKIYPNPTKEIINIQFDCSQEETNITLLDILGKKVFSKNLITTNNSFKTSIEVNDVPRGLYILKISSSEGNVKRKIILN